MAFSSSIKVGKERGYWVELDPLQGVTQKERKGTLPPYRSRAGREEIRDYPII